MVFSCASSLSVEGALAMWKREMPIGHQVSLQTCPISDHSTQWGTSRYDRCTINPGIFSSNPVNSKWPEITNAFKV